MEQDVLYPDKDRMVESYLKWFLSSEEVTPNNKKAIHDFVGNCRARGLSCNRILFYLDRLKGIVRIVGGKDFRDYEKEDVERVMASLNRRGLSPWTIECFITTFKAFWRWLYDLSSDDRPPKCVSWLKKTNPPNRLTKEDLITPSEFESMMQAATSLRDKALLATLYETGARPGELRGMTFKDCTITDSYIKLYVAGKMAKKQGKRAAYIIKNASIVRAWMEQHPYRDSGGYIWSVKGKDVPIGHAALKKIIERLGERAGIERHIFPYLFRHTRGTALYSKHGSVYARRLMGHTAGSKMEQVYCHLSESDIEDVLMGKVRPEPDGTEDIETARKMDFATMILDRMADLPQFKELVKAAERELRDEGKI